MDYDVHRVLFMRVNVNHNEHIINADKAVETKLPSNGN